MHLDGFIRDVMTNVELKCTDIYNVWQEIGLQGTLLDERISSVTSHINNLLDEMLVEERLHKEQLQESIKKLTNNIVDICLELEINDLDLPTNLSLLETEKLLISRKETLLKAQKDLLEEFSVMEETERKLSERLNEPQLTKTYKFVPSRNLAASLAKHIDYLKNLKRERTDRFIDLRGQMLKCYEKLSRTLEEAGKSCCLVSQILSAEAIETFILSKENMFSMSDIVQQLLEDCERLDIECQFYRKRMAHLEKLLNPVGVVAKQLPVNNSGDTLSKLRSEVDRLEQLRLQYLNTLIETSQSQLYECWDSCFVSSNYRENFKLSIPTELTEDLLNSYEEEIKYWSDLRNQHLSLFDSFEKWLEMFSNLKDLKQNMKDPIVLQNRGGILLKLEKENKRLLRELPKLQEKVNNAFNVILSNDSYHALAMQIDNLNPCEFIKQCWQDFEDEKENEKRDRILKNSQNVTSKAGISVPKKPTKRPAVPTKSGESTFSCESSSTNTLTSINIGRPHKIGRFDLSPSKKLNVHTRQKGRRRSRSVPSFSRLPTGKLKFPPGSNLPVLTERTPNAVRKFKDDCDFNPDTKVGNVQHLESFFEEFNKGMPPCMSTFIQFTGSGTPTQSTRKLN